MRLLVGSVFVSEGIQKFLYPAELAAGRFAKIGIPAPEFMGPFAGGFEIVCGALLIIGLLTRLAAVVLLIDISVAILSTKIPIWPGHGYWRFTLPKLKHYGLLSMLHEARTDLSMLLSAPGKSGRWMQRLRREAAAQLTQLNPDQRAA